MSGSHRRRQAVLPATRVLPILQARAEELGTMNGHVLGVWQPAKKRYGKAAEKTMCRLCGMQAIAMPCGDAATTVKWLRENPGLLGDAVFEICTSRKIAEPPVGTLGLRS